MKNKKYFLYLSIGFLISLFTITLIMNANNDESNINIQSLERSQVEGWSLKQIGLSKLNENCNGNRIKVAILDSGIYMKHPDFGDNIKAGYNAINPNELPVDDNGHGTLVSGIIIAQNNNIGIRGIAPKVELYPIKVLDRYGEGSIEDVVTGIDWCIDNGIQVINMSFAILEDKTELKIAVDKAIKSGLLIVASSSNTYGGKVGYPAAYDKVFSVTAIDKDFNIGETTPRGKIDFSAPGVNILSTSRNGAYEITSGTSIAAPYVTGIIALILQNPTDFGLKKDKQYTYEDIYCVLKGMSKDLGEKGEDKVYGEGAIIIKNIKR